MRPYDSHELAWAAGFLDGEGCWNSPNAKYLKTGKTVSAIKIQACQVRREPLDRLHRALQVGRVLGPRPRRGNRQPIYEWRVTRFRDVHAATALLWPWLSEPKREQSEKALIHWIDQSRLR